MLRFPVSKISGIVLSSIPVPALVPSHQYTPGYMVITTYSIEVRLPDGRTISATLGAAMHQGVTVELEETQWHIFGRWIYSSFHFCH
jgi:hypothetical protein